MWLFLFWWCDWALDRLLLTVGVRRPSRALGGPAPVQLPAASSIRGAVRLLPQAAASLHYGSVWLIARPSSICAPSCMSSSASSHLILFLTANTKSLEGEGRRQSISAQALTYEGRWTDCGERGALGVEGSVLDRFLTLKNLSQVEAGFSCVLLECGLVAIFTFSFFLFYRYGKCCSLNLSPVDIALFLVRFNFVIVPTA